VTYSIVARDPSSGELGVALQSHFFSAGALVSWAEAGVGAVATQSVVEPAYGPRGLELMRAGASAPEALHRLLADDRHEDVRQVAIVDRAGRVAVHTGGRCIAEAGHRVGDQVSAQANIMSRATVWDAMVAAYRAASGDLASRLLAALDAAEAEGGDLRGRQSAALLVVGARRSGRPSPPSEAHTAAFGRWDRLVDLRVDDNPDPVRELHRLLGLRRAYGHADAGDELAARGEMQEALAEYAAAHRREPDNVELAFWHGVALAAGGGEEEARALLRQAFEAGAGWAELLRRLPAAGLFPDDEDLIARLTRSGQMDVGPEPEPTEGRVRRWDPASGGGFPE
jgi:uncharacterized Ntn-hydrolase superfamily protein